LLQYLEWGISPYRLSEKFERESFGLNYSVIVDSDWNKDNILLGRSDGVKVHRYDVIE
jgi:hypothetical protein